MDYPLLPELPLGAKHISTLKEYEHLFGYAALPDGTILTCKPQKSTKGILYTNEWRNKHVYKSKTNYVLLKTKTKISGKTTGHSVHRIIGKLFVPNPFNYPVINHKDTIKWHNWADNLEWTTHKGNSIHALQNNLRDTACGTRLPNAVLTDDDIVDIFKMKADFIINKKIAEKYKIDESCISRIINRKRWNHVHVDDILVEKSQHAYRELKSTPKTFRITKDEIKSMKERRTNGERIKDIAIDFGIIPNYCGRLINNS